MISPSKRSPRAPTVPATQSDGSDETGEEIILSVLDGSPGRFATFTGKDVKARIELTKTVADLKVLINRRQGLPVEHQEIMFSGLKLEDNTTLASNNVVAHSKLHVVNIHK